MSNKVVHSPPRPVVRVGAQIYEVVEVEDLRALIPELEREIYRRTPPAAAQHRAFAWAVLAAAVNALRAETPAEA